MALSVSPDNEVSKELIIADFFWGGAGFVTVLQQFLAIMVYILV